MNHIDHFLETHPIVIDTLEELGYPEADILPQPITLQQHPLQPVASSDIAQLSQHSFTIQGNGKSADYWRDLHRKWFSWWSYAATGIFCRANEQIQIRVNGTRSIDAFIGTAALSSSGFRPQRRTLNPGLNAISATAGGLLYFSKEHTGTISVDIVSGGIPSPRFILGKHTLTDWNTMFNEMTGSGLIELESERAYIAAKRQNANNGNPITLLQTIDQSIIWQDQFSGLATNHSLERDRPDPYQLAFIETTGFFAAGFATNSLTAYSSDAISNVLHVDRFKNRSTGWVAWHEPGHTRQQPAWMWHKLTEVTTDLYSMYVARAFGNDSRLDTQGYYNQAQNFRNQANRNYDEIANNYVKLVMFWQLALAFGDNFYPRLHQIYRALPNDQVPSGDSGEIGKQLFIYIASLAADRNLRPFFEAWGIVPSTTTINRILHLPPLTKDIWNGRDSAPIIEYIIPDNLPLPNPTPIPPPPAIDLNGQQGVIHTALSPMPVIDASGNNLVIQTPNGSNNQLFEFTKISGDTYLIKSVGRNQFLVDSQQNITLTANQATATRWQMNRKTLSISEWPVYEIQSTSSQRVMDLAGSSTTNGSTVLTWSQQNSTNQQWLIELKTGTPPPVPKPDPPRNVRTLAKQGTCLALTWDPPLNHTGITHYNIYRDTNKIAF